MLNLYREAVVRKAQHAYSNPLSAWMLPFLEVIMPRTWGLFPFLLREVPCALASHTVMPLNVFIVAVSPGYRSC